MLAFRLTAENALMFFEICRELHADTEEKRLSILNAMVQLGKVEQVTKTPKTKEEYLEHLSKNFKVLNIKSHDSIGYKTPDDQSKGDTSHG